MEKVADKALDLLKALAEKMGTTVEQIYPYFVRQVWIESLTDLAAFLLMASAFGVSAKLFWSKAQRHRNKKNAYGQTDNTNLYVGFWLSLVLGLVVGVLAVTANLPSLLNPHYYAIKEILKAVKP